MPNNPCQAGAAGKTPDDIRTKTFVVVAAYNEAPSVGAVVRSLQTVCPNVVVVDDGSTDETFCEAAACTKFVLHHMINRGQGAALQTGIEFALRKGARFIVTFDADGQHRVEDIHGLLQPIYSGECDVTLGSRFLGRTINLPPGRRLTLRLGILFTRIFSRVTLSDAHNGLRAFSRRAAENINITLDGMGHASELIDIIARSGLAFREVPVHIRYTDYSRTKGQSSAGALCIALDYLLHRLKT